SGGRKGFSCNAEYRRPTRRSCGPRAVHGRWSIRVTCPLSITGLSTLSRILPPTGAIPYISSYGCPYACSFCAEPNQALGKWRGRSPRQMADDLAALRADYAPRRINIYDPNFCSSVRRVIEFVDLTIDEELDMEKSCDMRATDVLRMARNMDLSRLRRAGS